MYKAVISDLDGTLLNKNHTVSQETIDTVKKFVDKGYKFYVATGRMYKRAKPIIDKIGIKADIICLNGARIVDQNGNELYSKKLDKKDNDIILSIDYKSFGKEIFINGYVSDEWYVVSHESDCYYEARNLTKEELPTVIPEEEYKKIHFNKIYYVGDHNNLLELEKYLQSLSLNINISFVSENCLELYHKECTKFTAALQILKRDNLKIEQVIAFGDGINDIELLLGIPNSFYMENSIYILKDKLKGTHVKPIGNSSDHSVAKTIEDLFDI